jgi:hypothetical protein
MILSTRIDKQFTVTLINRPGRLAQLCGALARDKVNIVALAVADASELGLLRLVVEQPEGARRVITALNFDHQETDVLVVEMPHRPGVIAQVAELLGKEHVNIQYAYVSSGAAGGKTVGVFKVSDMKKAEKVLADASSNGQERHRELPKKLRRTPAKKPVS